MIVKVRRRIIYPGILQVPCVILDVIVNDPLFPGETLSLFMDAELRGHFLCPPRRADLDVADPWTQMELHYRAKLGRRWNSDLSLSERRDLWDFSESLRDLIRQILTREGRN